MANVCAFFVAQIVKNKMEKRITQTGVLDITRVLVMLLMLFAASTLVLGQSEPETAKPLTDMEVERKVSVLDIEGKLYENVTITFKSTSPDYFITDKYKVKVKAVDGNGRQIYKKTFKNVFLYVFSSGQVQVGKNNFDQVVVYKSSLTNDYIGVIREKEGV